MKFLEALAHASKLWNVDVGKSYHRTSLTQILYAYHLVIRFSCFFSPTYLVILFEWREGLVSEYTLCKELVTFFHNKPEL